MGDLNIILERIVALRQSIVDDGMRYGVPFRDKDLVHLTERLRNEGSSFVKVTCPLLGKALDAALISGIFKCPTSFATRKGTRLPRFLYDVFDTILTPEGDLRVSPNITSIFFLRQFLSLDGKLITEPTAEQKATAVTGFVLRQRNLGKTKVPRNHPVLQRAQRLLTRVLRRCDLSAITPGHGPGVVAEGADRLQRWVFNSWPSRAERWYPYSEYGSQSFQALCLQGPPVMKKISITKCALVPKDFKGPRLISAESAATQYLQQGQMKLLMQFIENHPLAGKSIRFRDQTWNQYHCQEAYDNGVATLDLSNASDTVSAALVWYLLAGVPKLRSQLFSTRSQYMKIEGHCVRLTAFSPMGSAVCFPVETLVFWSLAMASTRHVQHSWNMSGVKYHAGSKDPMLPSESEMASAIAVFGDDILVPDYALAVLIGTLTEVGCEVNTSKTCYQTPFRESCGAEYFNRIDIALIRNRRYDYDVSKKLINNPVLLDLQRKFFLRGLFSTAALLRQWAIEISPVVTQVPRGCKFYIRDLGGGILDIILDFSGPRSSSWHGRVLEKGNFVLPLGLNRYQIESGSFDDLCCAFGFDASLSSGVRTRYNAKYQRMECRLPRVFQRTLEWDHLKSSSAAGSAEKRAAGGNRNVPGEARLDFFKTGYPRLLARVTGDSVERIAIRTVMVKMAWSELPSGLLSQVNLR